MYLHVPTQITVLLANGISRRFFSILLCKNSTFPHPLRYPPTHRNQDLNRLEFTLFKEALTKVSAFLAKQFLNRRFPTFFKTFLFFFHWNRAWTFISTNLYLRNPILFCGKLCWNYPAVLEKSKMLNVCRRTDKQGLDKMWQENSFEFKLK